MVGDTAMWQCSLIVVRIKTLFFPSMVWIVTIYVRNILVCLMKLIEKTFLRHHYGDSAVWLFVCLLKFMAPPTAQGHLRDYINVVMQPYRGSDKALFSAWYGVKLFLCGTS